MDQSYPVQVRARLDEPLSRWLWLVVKGFRPSPITADMTAASTPLAYQDGAV